MRAAEHKARLVAALVHGVEQAYIAAESSNGELLLGGVVHHGPSKLKVRVVDKDYRPHTWIITIEESQT